MSTEYFACQVTHSQLKSGPCPWCVARGTIDLPTGSLHVTRKWKAKELQRTLASGCLEEKSTTIANLSSFDVPLDISVELLRQTLFDPNETIEEQGTYALLAIGEQLTHDRLSTVTRIFRSERDDPAIGILMLGYAYTKQQLDHELRRTNHSAILMLIENFPTLKVHTTGRTWPLRESQEDFDRGRKAWIEWSTKEHRNVRILRNAAFFLRLDQPELSEELEEKAAIVEKGSEEHQV